MIAALAPAPRELVQQYQGVFLGARVPSHPAPPPPPSLEDDEFYEPAVVTGEVSVFNAALDRPGYEEDEEWVDGAELKFVDVMREKAEIAKTAWSGVSTWVSDATGSARALFAKDQVERETDDVVAEEEEETIEVDETVAGVDESVSEADVAVPEEDAPVIDSEPAPDAPDAFEFPEDLPPVPAPEPEDLDDWVRGLAKGEEDGVNRYHPSWRPTSKTEEDTV